VWVWVIVALVVAAILLYLLFPMGADQTRPISHLIGPSIIPTTSVVA
jgi:hypothetical protein